MKELPKAYNPKEVEDEIYERWETSGFFNPDNLVRADDRYWNAEAYSIAIPPPNVTGNLHIGHAMFLTIQDIMTRHARMQGKKTLWLPGTDHAAIATNFVVEREIWEKEKKTRHDLGREEFLARIDEWIAQTQGTIQKQIRKMGASCDWSREKYTLSDELSLAVKTVFTKMHRAGLIYRGNRIINWCPRCATTLANDEVEYKTQKGVFYYLRYPVVDSDESISVATVRPETMLGDTAVAVNPKDKRFKNLVGKSVMLPLVNREIPVVADEHVDPDFGTGAVKVTPGHSADDFEIAQRHDLDIISFLTKDGKVDREEAINHGFEDYAGMSFEEARTQVVTDLSAAGFLEKQEEIEHNVGYCYRCSTVAEPMLSKQWFVDVNKKYKVQNQKFAELLKLKKPEASLKEMGLAAVKSGAIKIVPKRFEKNYLNWMENLHDWNISRQIWFGHQLPVWYPPKADQTGDGSEEVYVGLEPPTEKGWIQDEDTLDTWFSSSIWTFSTLGWPEKTKDLKLYHPTTMMETGYDILFFWVARMVLMTSFALEDIPFETVYLHGLVRDEKGRKMSKSLRNVINPLEIINEYGTDALRLSLVIGSTPGQDLKISKTKITSYRNFANKLWNVSRFVLTNLEESRVKSLESRPDAETLADEWILHELELLIREVEKHFLNHQYGLAAEKLTEFTWSKFADWYLEISKIQNTMPSGRQEKSKISDKRLGIIDSQQILFYILQNLLRLWHPFIPFVTEHIWSQISDSLLMVQKFPVQDPKFKIEGSKIKQFQELQDLITGIRNLRAEYQVKPSQKVAAYIIVSTKTQLVKEEKGLIESLAKVRLNEEEVPEDKKMPFFIWKTERVYLILPDFDVEKEIARAEKKLEQITKQVDKLDEQLTNGSFVKKAPPEIVEKTKQMLAEAREQQQKLDEKISSLS